MSKAKGPVVLIVRDGWGRNPNPEHDKFNAVKLARTPRCDALLKTYPWTLIHTSGEDVGLPEGTMGNSEVGHQNLGAGRVVYQDSVRITRAIRTGEFRDNPALVKAITRARDNGKALHLLCLCSDAGVHSLLGHLYGMLDMCVQLNLGRVYIHAFTDGRDTGPFTGKGFLEQVRERCRHSCGRLASVVGRYYAMDRDNRWERVQKAYDLLTGRGEPTPNFPDVSAAVQDFYDHPTNDSQQGDEFITPRTIGNDWPRTRIGAGDSVVFVNFRGDRPRELVRAFRMEPFEGQVKASPDTGRQGFDRGPKLDLCFVTMTQYDQSLDPIVDVAYRKPAKMEDIAGSYLERLKLRQFRCAETEKFPHVTFFFNDYREPPFEGEGRQMAQSPRVATYDLAPRMSADEITKIVLSRLEAKDCEDFILVNFANGDMVGHTGKLDAAIKAVEAVDECVGKLVDATLKRGGKLIVTADHGNAEQMWDTANNCPHTAHTTYDVECIVVDEARKGDASGTAEQPSKALRQGGRLADVLPTCLMLMGLEKPRAMEGTSLLK